MRGKAQVSLKAWWWQGRGSEWGTGEGCPGRRGEVAMEECGRPGEADGLEPG